MKNTYTFLLLILAFFAASCNSSPPAATGGTIDLQGFNATNIPGSDAKLVTKKSADGKMLEQGVVRNSQKDGSWTVFHDNESIKSITGYINGVLNGAHLEFNKRGQLVKRVEYLNNQFHGLYGEYKYGRPLKEINYVEGVQEGTFRIWNDMGKMTQKGNNSNGKLDGTLQYFDEEENLIMQYEYKNGEVEEGGGLVN